MLKIIQCWKLTSRIKGEGHSGKQIHSSLSILLPPRSFPQYSPCVMHVVRVCVRGMITLEYYIIVCWEKAVCARAHMHVCVCLYESGRERERSGYIIFDWIQTLKSGLNALFIYSFLMQVNNKNLSSYCQDHTTFVSQVSPRPGHI